jgi:hypothetical protein
MRRRKQTKEMVETEEEEDEDEEEEKAEGKGGRGGGILWMKQLRGWGGQPINFLLSLKTVLVCGWYLWILELGCGVVT